MPNNQLIVDPKPENQAVTGPTEVYTVTRVIQAGQWIPLAGLTYPTAGTFTAVRI